MKISRLEKNNKVKIVIEAEKNESALNRLDHYLQREQQSILAKKSGKVFTVLFDDIYYLEATDTSTMIWTEKDSYETTLPLYYWIDVSPTFIRIHKSFVVNLHYVKAFQSTFNGRLIIILQNDDRLIVSRTYVSSLKQRLGGR